MTSTVAAEPAVESPTPTPADRRRRRIIGMAVWSAAFALGVYLIGVPTSDPLLPFFWLWTATIAWRNDQPWRTHLAFLKDWLPVVLLLFVYNISRGYADRFGAPHVTELIDVDVWMTGWFTDGKVPTVWLQQHLYDVGVVHWWEILVSIVYFSHFVAALAAAVVLWLRSREQWARFMRRWFVLCLAGLITYFAYPAAPPWWAYEYGYLTDPVARISTNGWDALGLHSAGNMLNALQVEASNPVAAMPSLHTAFALFVVVFFLPVIRRRWWPLVLAYPLAMTFTLVYSGEHYLITGLAERWWRHRGAARSPER